MISIFSLICVILLSIAAGAFGSFVILYLRKTNDTTNIIQTHPWSMGIYMDDIPKTMQNTLYLDSVPLKIYVGYKNSDFQVPRKGEEIGGIYCSGENRFELTGIVKNVFYNTDMNLIVVSCKCIDIQKIKLISKN